jgi:hypothetical protein
MPTLAQLRSALSDECLFPLLQVLLVVGLAFCVLMEVLSRRRAGFGGTRLIVTRSPATMGIYYGTYAAISGLLVAICLSAEYAKEHRVAWALLDAGIVSYLCLFNPWFRLKLNGLASFLASAERR